MPSILPKSPATAAEISFEWCDMIRHMLNLQGQPVRGLHALPIIEVKSLSTNLWHPLGLPAGGTMFIDFDERDKVMARIYRT